MRKQSSCICAKDATPTQVVAPPQIPPTYINPQLSSLTNDIAATVYQSGPNQQLLTNFLLNLSSETGINITHPAILPVALPLMMRYAAEGRHFNPADDGLKAPESALPQERGLGEYLEISIRRAALEIEAAILEIEGHIRQHRSASPGDLSVWVEICRDLSHFLRNLMVFYKIDPDASEFEIEHFSI